MKSVNSSLRRILVACRSKILLAMIALALCSPSRAAPKPDNLLAASQAGSQPASQAASKGSQEREKAGDNKQELLKKFQKILNGLQTSIRAIVSPERIQARLRGRTIKYRQIPVAKGAATPSVTKAAAAGAVNQKGRLLGDKEIGALAKGVVMTVDGMPVQASVIDELADYYGTYMTGSTNEHKTKAIGEIIKVRAAEARYKTDLEKIRHKIDAILEKITVKDADFAAVAKVDSEGPSGAQGGDLGFFPRERMVGAFARWAFTLGVGKVSPVFASPFGYHILKVTGRQKDPVAALDKVKASHILVMFTRDSEALRSIMQAAADGKSDVGVINKEWKELLPLSYR